MKDTKFGTFSNGRFITVPTVDEICEMLQAKFEHMQTRIDHLLEENAKLNDDAYKDNELASMKAQLEEMRADYYRGFPVDEAQQAAVRAWQKRHTEEQHGTKSDEQKLRLEGVSGGRWIYGFVPTSIGVGGVCICGACREKARREAGNPNDYSAWYQYREELSRKMQECDAEFVFQEIG